MKQGCIDNVKIVNQGFAWKLVVFLYCVLRSIIFQTYIIIITQFPFHLMLPQNEKAKMKKNAISCTLNILLTKSI